MSEQDPRQILKSYSEITRSRIFPSREQAIICHAVEGLKFKDYLLALSKHTNPLNIEFASRISNNRICIYMKSQELADELIKNHSTIQIKDVPVRIRKLINPTKRITLSNVSPHLPHDVLEKALLQINLKPASPISFVKTSDEELAAFKNLKTFQRQVFIHLPDNAEFEETIVPESLQINHLDETFRIFLHMDEKWCSICKSRTHITAKCTASKNKEQSIVNENSIIPPHSQQGESIQPIVITQNESDEEHSMEYEDSNATYKSASEESLHLPGGETEDPRTAAAINKRSLENSPSQIPSPSINQTQQSPKPPASKKTKSDDTTPAAVPVPLNLALAPAKDIIQQQAKTIKGSLNLQQIMQLIEYYKPQTPAKDTIQSLRLQLTSPQIIVTQLQAIHQKISDRSSKIRITKLIDKINKEVKDGMFNTSMESK